MSAYDLQKINIPSVPHVALKLLKMMGNRDINLSKIEEAVMVDQALTAKILKIANSAFYGLRRKIQSVSEAINVLGFRTLRDVILVASFTEMYKVFGLIEKKLWEHGVGVSLAAGILTNFITIVKNDEAILAGLLHDVGKIVINNNFPREYANCMNIVNRDKVNFIDVERELFGFDHAKVGGILAEKWGFAYNLEKVILYHHDINYIIKCSDLHDKYLLLIISLANSICTRLGVGYKDSMPELIKDEPIIRQMLGVSEKDYSDIVNLFIDSFANYLDNFMD